jgi:hypothetical protein
MSAVATQARTVCGDCLEDAAFVAGKWRHTRTLETRCRPLCTTQGCTADAVVRLGSYGFDGSCARFLVTGHACEAHKPAGAVEFVR